MPVLDFKEIEKPKGLGSVGDTFELFAEDLLEHLGFRVLVGPGRGADGGRDLVVEEVRPGPGGETRLRWLVSCKHKAHGGRAVGVSEEQDVLDRVRRHRCEGFLGVYSTLPSSGLVDKLESLRSDIEINIYHRETIERLLLAEQTGQRLASRYMPKSIALWRANWEDYRGTVPEIRAASFDPTSPQADDLRDFSVWNWIILENAVEALYWHLESALGVAILHCRAGERAGAIAAIRLPEADLARLRASDFEPHVWNYFEAEVEGDDSAWGIIKLQCLIGGEGVLFFYHLNYAKCELIRVQTRRLLDDWDDEVGPSAVEQ